MSTALEIYTNPGDLEITVGKGQDDERFAISIFRGPGHRYKRLVTSPPFASTVEEAIETIETSLRAIRQAVLKELENEKSFVTQIINPESKKIDESKTLNLDLINRIVEQLRQHQKVSTCELLSPTG